MAVHSRSFLILLAGCGLVLAPAAAPKAHAAAAAAQQKDQQSTGAAAPAPSNVEVGEAQEPHPLAQIFRSMALDSARDRPLDSASQRKTP